MQLGHKTSQIQNARTHALVASVPAPLLESHAESQMKGIGDHDANHSHHAIAMKSVVSYYPLFPLLLENCSPVVDVYHQSTTDISSVNNVPAILRQI